MPWYSWHPRPDLLYDPEEPCGPALPGPDSQIELLQPNVRSGVQE
jgi:hypothetical protein